MFLVVRRFNLVLLMLRRGWELDRFEVFSRLSSYEEIVEKRQSKVVNAI